MRFVANIEPSARGELDGRTVELAHRQHSESVRTSGVCVKFHSRDVGLDRTGPLSNFGFRSRAGNFHASSAATKAKYESNV